MGDRWHGGKGSKYRKVDQSKFDDNWDRIFGKKKAESSDEKDLKFTTAEDYMKDEKVKDESR